MKVALGRPWFITRAISFWMSRPTALTFPSWLSSVFYCPMGPQVVWLVARALGHNTAVLAGMLSVFAMVSAFSGGMNVAMDVIAGERERRSLVPLLANPVGRRRVIVGKWLAVMFFSLLGLLLCLLAFHVVDTPDYRDFPFVLGTGLIPVTLLAVALEIALSTCSSSDGFVTNRSRSCPRFFWEP